MTDALDLMKDRHCECGCGEKLVRRDGERLYEFNVRRFSNNKCYSRSRKGIKRAQVPTFVAPSLTDKKTIHPMLDLFLRGKVV